MEKNVQIAMLMDFYGPLLTPRQRQILSLHVQEDLSYGEIGQELGISRQGVADAVRKAAEQLTELEEKLGVMARHMRVSDAVDQAVLALDQDMGTLRQRVLALRDLMDDGEDDYGL